MPDACCHGETSGEVRAELRRSGETVTAAHTVGEVAARSPRVLAVVKELGLNHCCGAHLTLTQAAASAGVPIETVLARLRDVLAHPA